MKRYLAVAAITGITLFISLAGSYSAPTSANTGHCDYLAYTPKQDRWVRTCLYPSTPRECRAKSFDQFVGKTKYAEGQCRLRGVAGICSVPAGDIYFYEGTARDLMKGCEAMSGEWRNDLLQRIQKSGS